MSSCAARGNGWTPARLLMAGRKWEAGERAIPEPVAILLKLFLENPVLITMYKKFRPVYKR